MPPLQQRYYDVLIERVRTDRYPSHQLLDLIEKVDESWYPSGQMMDRVHRMLGLAAAAVAR
jgi:hypothetical protein